MIKILKQILLFPLYSIMSVMPMAIGFFRSHGTVVTGTKTITANGTWTPNTDEGYTFTSLSADIIIYGGGGGGAGGGGDAITPGTIPSGGGGGGGSSGGKVVSSSVTLNGTTTYTAVIGAGGTNGTAGAPGSPGTDGGAGSNSTFNGSDISLITSLGGDFGNGGQALYNGGAGGTAPAGGTNGNAGQSNTDKATGGSGGTISFGYGDGGNGGNGGDVANTDPLFPADGLPGDSGAVVIEWTGII